MTQQIGVIGLAAMGQNPAWIILNHADIVYLYLTAQVKKLI